jgi:murein DD-endopeptidase MepM/ murein hydrolase activator NlpD
MGLMRLRLVLALCLVGIAGILGVALFAPAAPAQADLDAARAEVAEATERLENLLDRLEDAQRRGNELAAQYWQVESGLQLLDSQVAQAEAEQVELNAERSELLGQVRDIALNQYVTSGQAPMWDDIDALADREAAEALAELIVGSDQGTLDRLAIIDDEYERTREALVGQRSEQDASLSEVTATQAGINAELEELVLIRGALEGELLALEASLAQLEQLEQERLAEAERQRLAEERRRAEEAAARAAELARLVPTPAPTAIPTATAAPTATPLPTPSPEPTVPNPTPSVPLDGGESAEPTATPIPNPTPSQPFPTATPLPTATLAPAATATPVPNPQPPVSSGGIVCPLAGPFTHTDDFNAPRAVGGVHRANDLIASTGTPVLAAASGTVDHRNSSVGGLSAHLKGDNGDYYFYTHLNGYENVGAGHVTAGTVIGYVGMTGNAPIPHLHFEIHRNGYGNYTNPYGPVRAACGT